MHLGTGNYNERTARVYTDFGLMTSSPAIAEDATAFFSALTGYSDPPRLKKLVMAPTDLRPRFLKLIDRERRRAEAGQPAEIVAKMNSLIDEEIIDALYAASQAGVRDQAERPRHLRAPARRAGRQRDHRGHLDRRSVPRALARSTTSSTAATSEVYLSSADWMTPQSRQARRADVPGRDADAQARVISRAARDVPRQRQGALARPRRRLPSARRRRPASSRSGCSSISRKKPAAALALARERAGVTFTPERL